MLQIYDIKGFVDVTKTTWITRALKIMLLVTCGMAHGSDLIVDDSIETIVQRYAHKLNIKKQEKYGPVINSNLLFPTVVQDCNGKILGLVYSSCESLTEAIKQKKGIYYSRSREGIWFKSPSGKNSQDLIDIKLNCDGTALLFIVEQHGVFCHEGCKSCFDSSLNADLAILNPLPTIKIGFCKGRQSDMTFKLLDSLGICAYNNQLPRSIDMLIKSRLHPNIQLIEIKSKDVATILNSDLLDAAICYDNVIPKDVEAKFIKLGKQDGIHSVKIVSIKRANTIIPPAPIIFSEFSELTQEWIKKYYPDAKVVLVQGGAETFLAKGLCDIAVVVQDKGDTIKVNNFEVCDCLGNADLFFYISPSFQARNPNFVRQIKNGLQDKIIYFFEVDDTDNGFLSNFYPAHFQTEEQGVKETWKTAEHYYHAAKFQSNSNIYQLIKEAATAKEAYKLAHYYADKVRLDWEQIKDTVMRKAIFYKFSLNTDLKQKLKATQNRYLAEHSMKDYYWGIGANNTGKNKLGLLLMELRDNL